jgi:hypothetical protein
LNKTLNPARMRSSSVRRAPWVTADFRPEVVAFLTKPLVMLVLALLATRCSEPRPSLPAPPSPLTVISVQLAGDWTVTLSFPGREDSWGPSTMNGSIVQEAATIRGNFLSPSPGPGSPEGNHFVSIFGLLTGSNFAGTFDMVNRAGRCSSVGLVATGTATSNGEAFLMQIPSVAAGCRLPDALLTFVRR